jgi:uncharacterized membrane protein YfcA
VTAGPLRDLLTVLVGLGTGVLSAMFGVGGALIAQPALRFLGAAPLVVVGTTLPPVLPTAITATIRYHRQGLVDWRAVAYVAPPGMLATVGAAYLAHQVPGDGHLLLLVTAGLLVWTALRMLRDGVTGNGDADDDTEPDVESSPRGPLALGLVGAGAGALSGLLGIGGGVLLIPAFSQFVRLPLKRTIATSIACVGLLTVPSTLAHAWLGDVDWRLALWLCVGVVPGAWLGARITVAAGERRLRLAIGVLLTVIAVSFAVSEIPNLLRAVR